MLETIREKMNISEEKFFIGIETYGNTVSSTIPIALKDAEESGKINTGDKVIIVGFGVGYSWGANLLEY